MTTPTNFRICKWCYHLFAGTVRTVACPNPDCRTDEMGWSVHLDNASNDVLVALIPAIVRKIDGINDRLDRLEGLVVP